MNTLTFSPSDRLLSFVLPPLFAFTLLAAAAQTHLLCSVFCIHGNSMITDDICSSRTTH
jgi:hypothetical protein